MPPAVRFVVRGRVQGVGFRAYVLQQALLRGLKGEVWNRRDGAVEGIAQAESGELANDFLVALWEGPGRVDDVSHSEEPTVPSLVGFRIGVTR